VTAICGGLAYGVAAYLLGLGIWGAVRGRGLVHLVISISIMQASTYVFLIAVGYREGGIVPVFADHPPGTPAVDPVVQSLVLTDIVVGTAVSALILVLGQLIHEDGPADPSEVRPFAG
jgi:multicomponent Na+:H+ antiporter subunit C